jgi:hypothetical protein
MNLPVFGITPGTNSPYASAPRAQPRYDPMTADYEDSYGDFRENRRSDRSRRPRGGEARRFGYGKPVCVKLCDGSFFPAASAAGGEAACAAQCPDAPTALYTMPTDRIEDAVSSTGEPYTKLPVAGRFETRFESACTCHRDIVSSAAKELLKDPTLRRGDIVMTSDGFRVYEGAGDGAARPQDFVTLAKAPNVASSQRAELAAMQRSSAGSPAIAGPSVVVGRPKGRVTVDDGAPARAH